MDRENKKIARDFARVLLLEMFDLVGIEQNRELEIEDINRLISLSHNISPYLFYHINDMLYGTDSVEKDALLLFNTRDFFIEHIKISTELRTLELMNRHDIKMPTLRN